MWLCEKLPQCRGIEMPSLACGPTMRGKADRAYDAVLRFLYSCTHMPGQHLNEKELASKLNIGRTPVREALIRLAAEGRIVSVPREGFFTRPLLEWALLDSYIIARQILTFALTRVQPQASHHSLSSDVSSPSVLALQAETIFAVIAQGSSSCELCQIIEKFCFGSHPLRMEIAASELSPGFEASLARLTDVMPQFGNTPDVVKSALMNHLDFEEGAIPGVLQEFSRRRLESFPLIT
ncbi:GntR family transcriptional regulator (plasmid) [Sinorhizobium garamanticum]|uniref:GntR family transcriptional regulator n=1 Tax=Sinorhizobium garamanticum TaxID=680247 RepID=A0ABY8DSE5_9HYPH|nr:GntR family transcriptional regulator [Sinorhizobium garamanticum]WEX91811.1 GntR family transcriptional regulator [Sinorhizobium garamanticum]